MANKLKWSEKRVWGYWNDNLLSMSVQKRGKDCPELHLYTAMIVLAAEDRDVNWLNSKAFAACCTIIGLDFLIIKKCLLNSIEYLDGARYGDFKSGEEVI